VTEDGFEYQGQFYRWHVTDMGKDLMLIDRFCGMPVTEFFNIVDDALERERAPILLALVATSIRDAHPGWSVERIVRTVMDLSMSDLVFVEADSEEPAESPPVETAAELPTSEPSRSPSNGSSPPSTPLDGSSSETSFAAPV
jgi:hypothetical protein